MTKCSHENVRYVIIVLRDEFFDDTIQLKVVIIIRIFQFGIRKYVCGGGHLCLTLDDPRR